MYGFVCVYLLYQSLELLCGLAIFGNRKLDKIKYYTIQEFRKIHPNNNEDNFKFTIPDIKTKKNKASKKSKIQP